MTTQIHIVHATENFSLVTTGLTIAQIQEAIELEGLKIGTTSLRKLMRGEVEKACDFSLLEIEDVVKAPTKKASNPAKVKEVQAAAHSEAPEVQEEAPVVSVPAVSLTVTVTTPEVQAAVVAPVTGEAKVETGIKVVRANSKMHLAMIELASATGATIKELMAKFGYSQGGAGATVFCKQAGILSKGYALDKEKDEARYSIVFDCKWRSCYQGSIVG